MRITHALALIGAAAASFSASAAPAANNVDTSMNQVSVTSHSYRQPTEGDLAGLKGAYQLEDGRTLRVSSRNQHLYAQVGDIRTEILAVGPNKFASRNDALRVSFNDGDYPNNVVVSTIAGQ